jgi:Family of unknown function (DUF6580)
MLAYLFVLIAALWRVIMAPFPSLLGFTPLAASLLFFGARMERKRLWIPLVILIGSDLYLTYQFYGYKLTPDQFATWAWYVAALGLGGLLRQNSGPIRLVGTSLTASVSFFLVSNFAVWLAWNMYPKTLAGLLQCYAVGVPYFRHSVLGDLVFTVAFFAVPALLGTWRRAEEVKVIAR